MRLNAYSTLVFDCDGVVLDSNKVKTKAFREAALPYGQDAAEALVGHHIRNGGISRYKKFAYFLESIVQQPADDSALDELLQKYSASVLDGLRTCEVSSGLMALRHQTSESRWLIVSGGDQDELRQVFRERQLADLFDGGIFGSPCTKDEILAREVNSGNIRLPALFLGDSRYDHIAATAAGLDFVFVSGWSEFHDYRPYCREHSIETTRNLSQLLLDVRK